MRFGVLRMSMAKSIFIVSFICAAGVSSSIWAQGVDALRIATGTRSGAYYRIGEALSDSAARQGKFSVTVIETDGSLQNIEMLRSGRAEFGFIQGGLGVDTQGLAALADVDRQYVHLIVPSHSRIRNLRSLAGKRLAVGPEKSGASALAATILQFQNFRPPVTQVHVPWKNIEKAMNAGRADAAFFAFSLWVPYVESILEGGLYRLVPIPEGEAIARYLPGVSFAYLPPHLYGPNRSLPDVPYPGLPTLSVSTLLITRKDMNAGKVRALLDALYDIEVIKQARLSYLSEDSGRHVADLALHDAADDFYRRNDPITSDNFEIASFFLAGLITLVSMFHYFVGWAQRKRSNRRRRAITPHFERMVEIGEEIECTETIDGLAALIEQLMAVQRQVEHLWLRGQLDTEHVENLYSIYSTRSRNTFSKILKIQNDLLLEEQREFAPLIRELARRNDIKIPEDSK